MQRTIVLAFGVVPTGVSLLMLSHPRFAAIWLAVALLAAVEVLFDEVGDGAELVGLADVVGLWEAFNVEAV